MGRHARIENGRIVIDTAAWLEQRTAGALAELTDELHAWAGAYHEHYDPARGLRHPGPGGRCPDPRCPERGSPPRTGTAGTPVAQLSGEAWQQLSRAWCTAHGYHGLGSADPGPDPAAPFAWPMTIHHEGTRLDADLWLGRAQHPYWGPFVVVQQDAGPPTVYADHAREAADWDDTDSVDITCPHGHGWTWHTDTELIDAGGNCTTLAAVFGPHPDAPFTPCPDCTAFRQRRRRDPCRCDGSSWIRCPLCGSRCDAHLPTH